MNSYIDKIKSLVSKRLDNSIVVHLLSLIRKELEVTNQLKNSSFNALRLFCDWALHNQIDRSDIGSSVIIDINKIVGIMQNIPNNAMLIEFISTLLLERFRNQIKNFFQENSIENQITNDEQWKVFLRFLFSSLEETDIGADFWTKKMNF